MKKILLGFLFVLFTNYAAAQSFTCNNGEEIEGLEILEFKLSDDKKSLTYANSTVQIKEEGDNYVWSTVEKPFPMNPKKTMNVKRELKKDISSMTVYGTEKKKWKCTKK